MDKTNLIVGVGNHCDGIGEKVQCLSIACNLPEAAQQK